MSLTKLITDIKSSLWFVPSAMVLFSIGLAVGALEIDGLLGDEITRRYPRLFGAGAEGSRQLLSAIASSTITVAGVVFSITIVALSLAAAQYSPRVLRNFMSDRANQVVLGVFVGVFVYCLLVLRTIRGGEEAFIPGVSVLIAIALALAGIAVLIFFIHHIASSIQVSEMAARIARETMAGLKRVTAESRSESGAEAEDALLSLTWYQVPATASGYMQRVNKEALMSWGRENRRAMRIEKFVGEFVIAGECLVLVSGSDSPAERDVAAINRAFTLNTYRDLAQDPAFGVQQLVDIALKALSPGVNDTGTARDALNYITSILLEVAGAPSPARRLFRSEGMLLLSIRVRTFEEYMQLAFAPLRRNAATNFDLTHHLLEALSLLADLAGDPHIRNVIAQEIAATDEAFQRAALPTSDKLKIVQAVQAARERLHATARGAGIERLSGGKPESIQRSV
jgi:uncharacterized membrane protein